MRKKKRNWSVISFRVFHVKIIRLFPSRQPPPQKKTFGRSPFNSSCSCKVVKPIESGCRSIAFEAHFILFYFIFRFFAWLLSEKKFRDFHHGFLFFSFRKSRVTSCAVFHFLLVAVIDCNFLSSSSSSSSSSFYPPVFQFSKKRILFLGFGFCVCVCRNVVDTRGRRRRDDTQKLTVVKTFFFLFFYFLR